MLKLLTHPTTGQTFKMGRRRPVARGPRFSLKNYIQKSLPAPPAVCNYAPKATAALEQIYLNDTLGDCVIACMAHTEDVLTGNAGVTPTIYTPQQITKLYSEIGGYMPGNPSTDNGCDEQTALNYWQRTGNPLPRIQAWMAVNGNEPLEVRTALWLFENLMFGVELPDAWVNPMPSASGFTWGAAGPPDPDNGHCFLGCGYSPSEVIISTWGMTGYIENAAIEKYATTEGQGELYAVISTTAIAKATQKAPNGFDWSQLLADFDSMKG